MSDSKYYLIGAGGHAKVVWEAMNSTKNVISGCFADDYESSTFHKSLPHLGKNIQNFIDEKSFFNIAIGNNKVRKKIANMYNCNYYNAIHKQSIISKSSIIGLGNSILARAVINPFSEIGNHCIINTAAVIEHDNYISDYVHISPNVTLCGNVRVGEGTHIGAGAVIIPNINIGKWCVIGAGAVIIRNIPDNAVVVGNPGRIIKIINNE